VVRTDVVARVVALSVSILGLGVGSGGCSSAEGVSTDVAPSRACEGEGCGAREVAAGHGAGGADESAGATSANGIKDGGETDVDCGGERAPRCSVGQRCLVDRDCDVACNHGGVCVSARSCRPRFGGDTCGVGEVGEAGAVHESCCRTLEVPGYEDPAQPGKKVYLDKYEITAGRVRAFVEQLAAEGGGVANVKGWIAAHRPRMWDVAWDRYLPSADRNATVLVPRRLLGDPRPEDAAEVGPPGAGVVLPPPTDELRRLDVDHQFGSEIYVDLHGMSCATHAGSYGFSTYHYPPEVLARNGQLPRVDGLSASGAPIPAKDHLDTRSMNCITNAMLAAFCAWDGGQLATDEVLDHVTASPSDLGSVSGCGSQRDSRGWLLNGSLETSVQTGGRCAAVDLINATFDAGGALPTKGSPLNRHNYRYPALLPGAEPSTHDKAWQVAAPGRGSLAAGGQQVDLVRMRPGDEPWVDLHGNLQEAALDTTGPSFHGEFTLKYRGVGYGSARSDLNVTRMPGEDRLRIARPEAKAAYTGGRCMRFR